MALWPQAYVQRESALWKAGDPRNPSGAGRDLLCGIVLVKDPKNHRVPGLLPSNPSGLTAGVMNARALPVSLIVGYKNNQC